MSYESPHNFDADRRLDALLTSRPTDAQLDRLCDEVADNVMFAIRADAAGATPVSIHSAAEARRASSPRWRIGLVAAAALSAGVTLGLAGVAGLGARGLASGEVPAAAPEIAVAGPSEIVAEPAAVAAATAPAIVVTRPMSVVAARPSGEASIVAFAGMPAVTDTPAAADGKLAGVASPFGNDIALVPSPRDVQRGPRRLVVAAIDTSTAGQPEMAE